MGETKHSCSFEAGKTQARMDFDGGMTATVSGTSDKFSGEYTASNGQVTPFTQADIGQNGAVGTSAEIGSSLIATCASERSTAETKKSTQQHERNSEAMRWRMAPGLEV